MSKSSQRASTLHFMPLEIMLQVFFWVSSGARIAVVQMEWKKNGLIFLLSLFLYFIHFFVALGSFKRSTVGEKPCIILLMIKISHIWVTSPQIIPRFARLSNKLAKKETFLGNFHTLWKPLYLAAKLAAFRLFAPFANLLGFDTSESLLFA